MVNLEGAPLDPLEVSPLDLVGQDQVKWVQVRLLELGYTDGGPADGILSLKTEGTILDFRNRNGLPLLPSIDQGLIMALVTGPSIELPRSQVEAQTPEIAERVVAVKETWYARFWAKVLAVPSLSIALLMGILDNFGEAVALLAPVRTFLQEGLSTVSPMTLTAVMGLSAGVIAVILWRKAANTESALVTGYRDGTVKNDVEAAKENL